MTTQTQPTGQHNDDQNLLALILGGIFVLPALGASAVAASEPTQREWLARGWLAPLDGSVVELPGGIAGLDIARLTVPAGLVLIALAGGLSVIVHMTRRRQGMPVPYRVWQRDTLALLVAAVWAVMAAPEVTDLGRWLAVPSAFWLVAAAVTVAVVGIRANARHADVRRAIEQIAEILGGQAKRGLVTAHRWSQEWPTGGPGKIIVRYPSAALEHDHERQNLIVRRISAIWGPYHVERIDTRRHLLLLTPGHAKTSAARDWRHAKETD